MAHLILGLTRHFVIVADGFEYVVMAENLGKLGSFTFDGLQPVVGKPPGMSVIILAWQSLIGSMAGFQVFQLCLLFLSYLGFGAIARLIAGQRYQMLTVAVLVFLHPLNALATQPITEPAFLVFTAFGLLSLIRALRSHGTFWSVLSGVCFGLATYLRPITFFLPIVLLGVSLILRRHYVRPLVILALVQAAIITPWIVRTSVIYGRVVPMAANYGPLYYLTDEVLWTTYRFGGMQAIHADAAHREITGGEFQFNPTPSRRLYRAAIGNIRRDPPGYIWRCIRQASFVWSYVPGTKETRVTHPLIFNSGRIAMLVFYGLLVMGGRSLWRTRHRDVVLVLIGYTLYTAAMHLPVCTESRYLLPVYTALMPLALLGGRALLRPTPPNVE